jgi:hypothetical protein
MSAGVSGPDGPKLKNMHSDELSEIDRTDLKTSIARQDPASADYGKYDEHGREIPPWYHQITLRAIVVAAILGFVFNLM